MCFLKLFGKSGIVCPFLVDFGNQIGGVGAAQLEYFVHKIVDIGIVHGRLVSDDFEALKLLGGLAILNVFVNVSERYVAQHRCGRTLKAK